MEKIYQALAERNGWNYCDIDGRPYFMKDGRYATPDEHTSEEDKELLSTIISEGSMEMKTLIEMCWNHNIKIGGPCSGIKEFHMKNPVCLHFAMIGNQKVLLPLYKRIDDDYPGFDVDYRREETGDRLDIAFSLKDKELTTKQSDVLFELIRKELESILIEQKKSTSHK